MKYTSLHWWFVTLNEEERERLSLKYYSKVSFFLKRKEIEELFNNKLK